MQYLLIMHFYKFVTWFIWDSFYFTEVEILLAILTKGDTFLCFLLCNTGGKNGD